MYEPNLGWDDFGHQNWTYYQRLLEDDHYYSFDHEAPDSDEDWDDVDEDDFDDDEDAETEDE